MRRAGPGVASDAGLHERVAQRIHPLQIGGRIRLHDDDPVPGTIPPLQGKGLPLLSREPGWVSDDIPVALRNGKPADRSRGWLVHLEPGTRLRAPAGAKGLRVFDVQGRIHWEARDLRDGAPVSLPEGLPQGTLRYRWL